MRKEDSRVCLWIITEPLGIQTCKECYSSQKDILILSTQWMNFEEITPRKITQLLKSKVPRVVNFAETEQSGVFQRPGELLLIQTLGQMKTDDG